MKIKMTKYSVVPLLCLVASPLWAEPIPEWVGSYAAGGQCYCAPGMSSSLRNKIMPTPIGGQSIGQICERIGKGPALELDDTGFNHPAYHDAQCGNGPFTVDSDGCEGRLANNDSICSGTGPAWDLKALYSKPKTTETVAAADSVFKESPDAVESAALEEEPVLTAEEKARADAEAAEIAAARVAAARAKAEADNAAAARLEAAKIAASRRAVEENQSARDRAEELEQARLEASQSEEDKQAAARRAAAQAALERRRAERAPELARNTEAEKLEVAEKQAAKAEADRLAAAKAARDKAALEAEKVAARVEAERRQAESALANAPATEPLQPPVTEPEFKVAEPELQPDVASTDTAATGNAKETITDSVAESTAGQTAETPPASAVRLPSEVNAIDSSRGYIQFAPVSFDFGGTGPSLEGVLGFASAWQFKGRAAVVEEYSELAIGISRLFKPQALKGGVISLLAGWEYGNFDLGITELTDSGALLDSSLGFVVTPRMSLAAGVSYSSFFEGDPSVYGQLLFRVVNNLDFSTRVEGGDNDNFALGLRYNY